MFYGHHLKSFCGDCTLVFFDAKSNVQMDDICLKTPIILPWTVQGQTDDTDQMA